MSKIFLWFVVVVVIGGAVVFGARKVLKNSGENPTITPVESGMSPDVSPELTGSTTPSPSSSSKPSVSIKQKQPTQNPVPSDLTHRLGNTQASCALKGGVDFIGHSTFDNKDALFTYMGVDAPARNVHWTVTPNDNVRVGPNIFANLSLPDGSSRITILLPDQPTSRHYDLTAAVDYARVVKGGLKNFTAVCTGKISVDLKY